MQPNWQLQTFLDNLSLSSSTVEDEDCLILEGLIGYPETSVTAILSCITSQKREEIYATAKVWNHSWTKPHIHIIQRVNIIVLCVLICRLIDMRRWKHRKSEMDSVKPSWKRSLFLAFSWLSYKYSSGTMIKYDSLQCLLNRPKPGADHLHRVGLSCLPVNSVVNMTYSVLSTTSGQLLQYPYSIHV